MRGGSAPRGPSSQTVLATKGSAKLPHLFICHRCERLNRYLELREAAANGDVAAIHDLLKAGAEPNASNFVGNTPLHYAAHRGRTEAIEALLAAGADQNAKNVYGATPLDIALRDGRHEAARALGQLKR